MVDALVVVQVGTWLMFGMVHVDGLVHALVHG
jgi:hypothetical protein